MDKKKILISIIITALVIIAVVTVIIGGKVFRKEVTIDNRDGNATISDAELDEIAEKAEVDTTDADVEVDVKDETDKDKSDKKDKTDKDKTDKKDKSDKEEASTEKDKDSKKESSTEKNTSKKEESTTEAKKGSNKTENTTEAKGNDSGNKQQTTEAQKQQTTEAPKKENTTESKTEAPKNNTTEAKKEECSHHWVWKTHTETVHHSEEYLIRDAWDEPVYVNDVKCNCGAIFPSNDVLNNSLRPDGEPHSMCGGYVTHRSISGYTHHDAEYGVHEWDTYEEVKDYEYCDKCGQRK